MKVLPHFFTRTWLAADRVGKKKKKKKKKKQFFFNFFFLKSFNRKPSGFWLAVKRNWRYPWYYSTNPNWPHFIVIISGTNTCLCACNKSTKISWTHAGTTNIVKNPVSIYGYACLSKSCQWLLLVINNIWQSQKKTFMLRFTPWASYSTCIIS